MKRFVTVLLSIFITNCAAHSTNFALFTPYVPVHPLDEGYFPRPKYFDQFETGLVQEHPIVRFPDPHAHPHFPTEPLPYFSNLPNNYQSVKQNQHHQNPHIQQDTHKDRYLSFVGPSSSLVAYVPVYRGKPGPWAVPNVFIKGQGYSTNHYVAPALMKKMLAQDPR